MKIHCLQHLKNETLGSIGTWISQKGYTLTKTLLYENSLFPDPEEFDLLLIMGGTMSVYQEEEYPWLKPEKEFVKKTIEYGKPILGSCFGAQMIAEVLGGRVTKNRFKEIGWHKVRSTSDKNISNFIGSASENSIYNNSTGNAICSNDTGNTIKSNAAGNAIGNKTYSELPSCLFPEFTAFMWHGDTFEIPSCAVKLFESEACPNQGFIYNGNVLGLQFHPEADREWVRNLLNDSGHELIPGRYIQSEKEIWQECCFDRSRDLAFSLMDWLEGKCKNKG